MPNNFSKIFSAFTDIELAIVAVECTCNTYLKSISAWKEVSIEGRKLFFDIISSA